jgi:hypothetical protein
MAVSPHTDVVMAAASLKATAPEAFKSFCDTLRSYEGQSIVEMIGADGNDLFRAQGKTKTIQELRKHIVECYELKDKFIRRDSNARTSG